MKRIPRKIVKYEKFHGTSIKLALPIEVVHKTISAV